MRRLSRRHRRLLTFEQQAWDPERVPALWLWLRQWARRPRRVFWVFDLDTFEWREM